jgi:hypothetical protein
MYMIYSLEKNQKIKKWESNSEILAHRIIVQVWKQSGIRIDKLYLKYGATSINKVCESDGYTYLKYGSPMNILRKICWEFLDIRFMSWQCSNLVL